MKIAIFSDSFFPLVDGVTISIKNNAEIFSKKNKLYFFVPSETEKLKIKNAEYIRLKSFPIKSYKDYKMRIPLFNKVFNELRKIRPDIIHIHSLFGIGWEGLVAGKLLKIPVVATSHTIFPEVASELDLKGFQNTKTFQNVTWKYMFSFFKKCSAVITPSEVIKKELLGRGLKKEIYAVSNGIDTKKFPYIQRKNKSPVFLYLGRLVESKHVGIILKALGIIKKKGLPYELWIAGSGPEEKKLKDYSKKNKLSKSVKFLGQVKNDKVYDIYKKADIFVTASTIETEGITTLEAMATGLPVVGADARATPYLIKDDAGLTAPVGNEKEFAKKMLLLAKDYKLRTAMGKKASARAKEYDLAKANKKLYSTYKRIIENYKNKKD